MKAQTQVIQFILFFIISISIFSIVSSYLFFLSQSFQDRILSHTRELIASHTSNVLIYVYTGCKYCNYTNITYTLPHRVFDNFHEINGTNRLVYVRTTSLKKEISTSAHNLNASVEFSGISSTGIVPYPERLSGREITKFSTVLISFNKAGNKFKIGG